MQENIMNELSKEDLEVLKFLERFKMLKTEDAGLIYKKKRYYRQRINRLILKQYVKKYKSYIILDRKGRAILDCKGSNYLKNFDKKTYIDRLKNISNIATLTINSDIKFFPSWEIKDKNVYTETARRYIGKLNIDDEEYIVYYISAKKDDLYIKQLLFDVNKINNLANIIIFIEKFDVIKEKYGNLIFGKQNTYIILNTKENKEFLKKYCKFDVHGYLQAFYKNELLISNWENADYLIKPNKYIVNMPFINTERIERINWFYKENYNTNRELEVITLEENKAKLEELLVDKCKIEIMDRNVLGGAYEI